MSRAVGRCAGPHAESHDRPVRRVLITIAAVILATASALGYVATRAYRSELRNVSRAPASDLLGAPGALAIEGLPTGAFAAPGSAIAGWFAPSRNAAAVILLHGTGADRSERV